MYVPIARPPVRDGTLVATRSRSPASFIRWNTVIVPPSTARMSSTSGVGAFWSAFWRSHSPCTATRGSVTSRLAWVNWLVAVQVAVRSCSCRPPRWRSIVAAAAMFSLTPLCTWSPTEATSRVTSVVARCSSPAFSRATSSAVRSEKPSLRQAPTATSAAAVTITPPRPSASSLCTIRGRQPARVPTTTSPSARLCSF
jgi:hypothetical protein